MTLAPWFNSFNGIAVLLAGLFNLLGAWRKLDQALQIHPFIRPWRNVWIWGWIIVQMFCAGLLCLVLLDLPNKTVPTTLTEKIPTLLKAALVGSGFNAVLNADEATDFLGLNLGAIYTSLIDPITQRIHATQTRYTDRFWFELRNHLAALPTNPTNDGLNLLREKLTNSPELTPERRQTLLTEIRQIQDSEISRQERPGKIVELLKNSVRRHSLPELLNVLGCEDRF
jgi:hypothetical protein